MSLRKSSSRRNGSKSDVLPNPNARRRWTPAPSRVGLALMSRCTGRIDMVVSCWSAAACGWSPAPRRSRPQSPATIRLVPFPTPRKLAGREHAPHAVDRALDIVVRCPPATDADAHGALSAPGGAGEERLARAVDLGDHRIGATIVLAAMRVDESDEALVQDRLGETLGAGQPADLGDQCV